MTSVRRITKTTATLVALIVVLGMLMHWCKTLSSDFLYQMDLLLNSKKQIGGFHGFVVSLSFWLLLLSSGLEAVFKEESGIYIFRPFRVPIIFSLCVAVWGFTATLTEVSIVWFWLFYYVGLFVCIRMAYGRISSVEGAGDPKIKNFLKTPPSSNDADVSIVDRYILYICKAILLLDCFILLVSLVVFCIQNKSILGI